MSARTLPHLPRRPGDKFLCMRCCELREDTAPGFRILCRRCLIDAMPAREPRGSAVNRRRGVILRALQRLERATLVASRP